MVKKYVVRLSSAERAQLFEVIKKLKGTSQKVRRAHILLMADADGPNWTDAAIAEAYHCRTRTVECIRERLVTLGFAAGLNRKKRETPPTSKALDRKQEAEVIALRLSQPPSGFGSWTLRLLARQIVELEIAGSICPETVRQTIKKRNDKAKDRLLGNSSRC